MSGRELTGNGRAVALGSPLLVLIGAVLRQPGLLVVGIGLALALLVALATVAVRRPRRVELEVTRWLRPRRVVEGQEASTSIHVTNRTGRRSPPLVVEDHGLVRASATVPALAPDEDATVTIALDGSRRGHHRLGPVRISYLDPLRLVRVVLHEGERTTWVVHPRARPVPLLVGGQTVGVEDEAAKLGERGGVTFHSLREYVAGDELRLIHWRSSARTGALMARHETSVERPDLLIVVDAHGASYDDPAHFDEAVRIAASMAAAGIEAGHGTAVTTTAGVGAAAVANGRGRIEVLDLLAGATTDDDLGLVDRSIGRARGGRLAVGLVSGHPEARRLTHLVAQCRPLASGITVIRVGQSEGQDAALAGLSTVWCRDLDDLAERRSGRR